MTQRKVSLFFILILTGCSSDIPEVNDDVPGGQGEVQTCVDEAKYLLKMNSKYQYQVSSLYKTIKDAKYYASLSKTVSGGVNKTISPFFQYKITNACNDITSSLIKEMKNEGMSDSVSGRNTP